MKKIFFLIFITGIYSLNAMHQGKRKLTIDNKTPYPIALVKMGICIEPKTKTPIYIDPDSESIIFNTQFIEGQSTYPTGDTLSLTPDDGITAVIIKTGDIEKPKQNTYGFFTLVVTAIRDAQESE